MYNDVVALLAALDITVTQSDTWLINFCIDKTENHILNICNVSTIPDGLHEQAVKMACGEFCNMAMNAGKLNYDRAVKRIKEGDTDIEYNAGTSDAELMTILIKELQSDVDFVAYRKFKW